MSSHPSVKIHSCSETVSNADFVDIDYTSIDCFNIPTITATAGQNVNVFISNVTRYTAKLNFSSKYTGTVTYTVISMR